MTQKIVFEKQVIRGKYQAIREVDKNKRKVLIMGLLKNGKFKTIWQIELSDNKFVFIGPCFGYRSLFSFLKFSSSADKTKTFIEIPKQLNEFEKLSYPQFVRKFLSDSSSSLTLAWLNLNGRRKNLGYFGEQGPNFVGCVVHKELLKVLSDEFNLQIKFR